MNRRTIERQRRILRRAIRRGERTPQDLETFDAEHEIRREPEPASEPASPFVLPSGKPLELRDLWAGQSLFILCGGPSIRSLDLTQLQRRGIMTFGINNSPTVMRTNFMVFVDQPRKFHDGIWYDGGCLKFCPTRQFTKPIRRKLPDGTFEYPRFLNRFGDTVDVTPRDCPGVVGYERNAFLDYDRYLSEPTINWGHSLKSSRRNPSVPRILNSMLAVLKISYVLGFRVLYLLGADFHMDPANPYGFEQQKDASQCRSNNQSYESLATILGELAPRFRAAGLSVFNCNPESHLTVFPHCPYDEAIRRASDHVAQDPLDASGWYELN